MDPGHPLSSEEATVVEIRLAKWFQTVGKTISTSDFIRDLGWPQRRLPDLRHHLERKSYGAAERVSKRLGIPFKSLSCTRQTIYYSDADYDPEALERESEQAVRSSLRLLSERETAKAVARFAFGQAQAVLHCLLPLAGLKSQDREQILEMIERLRAMSS
jgi:hypothetical protein